MGVHSLTKHVAGAQVAHAQLLLENRGLSALAGSRGADEDSASLLLLRAVHTSLELP